MVRCDLSPFGLSWTFRWVNSAKGEEVLGLMSSWALMLEVSWLMTGSLMASCLVLFSSLPPSWLGPRRRAKVVSMAAVVCMPMMMSMLRSGVGSRGVSDSLSAWGVYWCLGSSCTFCWAICGASIAVVYPILSNSSVVVAVLDLWPLDLFMSVSGLMFPSRDCPWLPISSSNPWWVLLVCVDLVTTFSVSSGFATSRGDNWGVSGIVTAGLGSSCIFRWVVCRASRAVVHSALLLRSVVGTESVS